MTSCKCCSLRRNAAMAFSASVWPASRVDSPSDIPASSISGRPAASRCASHAKTVSTVPSTRSEAISPDALASDGELHAVKKAAAVVQTTAAGSQKTKNLADALPNDVNIVLVPLPVLFKTPQENSTVSLRILPMRTYRVPAVREPGLSNHKKFWGMCRGLGLK